MKLYGTLLSPFVRKVRIMLHEKNLPYEFILCDQWAADSIILKMNPLSKVPVLELDGGEYLFESPFIMEWLDEHFGEPMLPAEHDARWRTRRWHNLANGMLDAVSVRNSELRRPREMQWKPARERAEGRITRALDVAEATRKDGEFLVGERITVADIALGVALHQIDVRYSHDWRESHPELARWHASISRRPSFADTSPSPESLQTLAAQSPSQCVGK